MSTSSEVGEAMIGMGLDTEPTIHTSATSESGYDGAFVDDGVTASTTMSDDTKHAGSSVGAATQGVNSNSAGGGITNGAPVSGHARTSRNSLGSETEGLVLFDLTTKPNEKRTFSPHCMKTILDLKLLNIGYDRQRLTFTQIRNTLSNRVSDTVTVPTLELFNGSHLTDSWNIAQYLYTTHPQGSRLFPNGEGSRSYARFMENYDEENQTYFEMEKVGKAKMDKFRNLSPQEKQKYIDATADALEPVQAALLIAGEKKTSPPGSSPVWLEGLAHPTHADFALYGWYVYSRVSGRAVTREIWNTHSAVAKWVSDMDQWAGPDITGDYF